MVYYFNFENVKPEQVTELKALVAKFNEADTKKKTAATVDERAFALQDIIIYTQKAENYNLRAGTDSYSHCCQSGINAMKQLNLWLSKQDKKNHKTQKIQE